MKKSFRSIVQPALSTFKKIANLCDHLRISQLTGAVNTDLFAIVHGMFAAASLTFHGLYPVNNTVLLLFNIGNDHCMLVIQPYPGIQFLLFVFHTLF